MTPEEHDAVIKSLFQDISVLPRVSLQTAVQAERELTGKLEDVLAGISSENDNVAIWIKEYAAHSGKSDSVKRSASLVYRMLQLSGPLPKVGLWIRSQLLSEFEHYSAEDYFTMLRTRMNADNPELLASVENHINNSPDKEPAKFAAFLTYRLLEMQAGLDARKPVR
jgi:hypothetical protein